MIHISDELQESKFRWSDLVKKEDWWAIWLGFIIVIISLISSITGAFSFKAARIGTWGTEAAPSIYDAFNGIVFSLVFTFIVLAILFAIALKFMGKSIKEFLIPFPILFSFATISYVLGAHVTIRSYIEYVFWALIVGLLISNTFQTPNWLKPVIRTEFYIKTGLVLMGAEILFTSIVNFGLYGLGIAWGVTPIVIIFMWIYGTKVLKIVSKPMVIIIATATSVCGISAAIAAAASSKAKKDDLSLAIGLTVTFTVLMMVLMPIFIKIIGLNELIGGAWIGGTVDSTGAVVLAGEALGNIGSKVAAVVKMIQNMLIGVIAFAIAIFWITNVEKKDSNTSSVSVSEIWNRFPKFILGFFTLSLIFSFVVEPALGNKVTTDVLELTKSFKGWCFCLAFVSIGFETNFKELISSVQGGKPLILYIVGQTFNLIITFLVAWILLSGIFFPIPHLTG